MKPSLLVTGLIVLGVSFAACQGVERMTNRLQPFARAAPTDEMVAMAELGAVPRNVVIMIADGFGPASLGLARAVSEEPLQLDELLVGKQLVHSARTFIPDSASTATAMATGVKTYDGAIGVDVEGRPLATVLEAAELDGKATGLVTTSTVTHATTAAFGSHVRSRKAEVEIAVQLADFQLEVLFGGGRSFFRPAGPGGARTDGRDLLAEARDAGVHVSVDRKSWDDVHAVPAWGLFADSHLDFEIDRNHETQPSLAEMTGRALELLAADEDGFMLVVEGARIDHAGHVNDAAAQVRDSLAYDAAVRVAVEFASAHGDTLVISTADHETGGLTLGAGIVEHVGSDLRSAVLREVRSSAGRMAQVVLGGADLSAVLARMAGLSDTTPTERQALEGLDERALLLGIADLINVRARIGWTTLGHTAVDVDVFATGPGWERFRGVHDNTHIGIEVARLLGYDLDSLTRLMRGE